VVSVAQSLTFLDRYLGGWGNLGQSSSSVYRPDHRERFGISILLWP
jgi:hypothetical protein